jgi:hypothetical protein
MNLTNCAQESKKLRFGVEVEMGEISIEKSAKLMAKYFSEKYNITSTAVYDGGYYREWSCKDHMGRKWKGMTDGSSSGTLGHISCEMVTPLLGWDDIEDLQEIIRIFRQNGAKSGVGYNAGVHIHVDAEININGREITSAENGQTAKTIRNLVNLMNSHNTILTKAINVSSRRRGWCRPVDSSFLDRMNGNNRPQTLRDVGIAWYGSESYLNDILDNPHANHYDGTRYQILNLHSMFTGKGFEFRCFEFHKGLHAGELKAWIQLCLAMCQYAKMVRYSRPTPIDMSNEKYAMNSWLKNMGLIGDEFKTCRKHMLKRLAGDTAYRHGRPNTDSDDLIDTFESDYVE